MDTYLSNNFVHVIFTDPMYTYMYVEELCCTMIKNVHNYVYVKAAVAIIMVLLFILM